VADRDLRQVDLDEFGQIRRQAADLDVVQNVGDQPALLLDRRRILGVREVQRHLDVYLLSAESAGKSMCCTCLPGMHVDARSSTGCLAPSRPGVRIDA